MEAREIPHGQADVIVCEAFAGNIILKLFEGVGSVLIDPEIKKGMMSKLKKQDWCASCKAGTEEDVEEF